MPSPLYLLLAKITIGVALACSVAWLIDYSRTGAWHNPVGRTLLTKTLIITVLLAISELTALFRLNFEAEKIISWTDLVLIALIAPVMVWRMAVFHRVSTGLVTCPRGHRVSSGARYCPVCGARMPSAGRAD